MADIGELSTHGLTRLGHHAPMTATGVPGDRLPTWESMQIGTAPLGVRPPLDDEQVGTDVTIGHEATKLLQPELALFVSDMSFGALSLEEKAALARGAGRAGTGICSGEGGLLPEEHRENRRYFYELASARFSWSLDKVRDVQAFHFKVGHRAAGAARHLRPGSRPRPTGRSAPVTGRRVSTCHDSWSVARAARWSVCPRDCPRTGWYRTAPDGSRRTAVSRSRSSENTQQHEAIPDGRRSGNWGQEVAGPSSVSPTRFRRIYGLTTVWSG